MGEDTEDYIDEIEITDINTKETTVDENDKAATELKVKERKMLFDRGYTDYFEEKQESKIFAVREKAYKLQKQIADNPLTDCGTKQHVKDQIKRLECEWPCLFGKEPSEIYIHVDLDSFYASVETLLNPEYKNVPLGVGSINMLAACNYEARKYGVRAGMPGYQARDLCPTLVFADLHIDKYNYYSERVMEILTLYDPEIEVYGIDEACLVFNEEKLKNAYESYNMRNRDSMQSTAKHSQNMCSQQLVYTDFSFESIDMLVQGIRSQVCKETKLTISAGISVCRGLAKFASKIKKPNGQYTISKDFETYLLPLEVDEINGIGKFTKELLKKALNIITINDLRSNLHRCYQIFKEKTFLNLLRLSFGLSLFDHRNHKERLNKGKLSHGIERSFKPISAYSDILFYLWRFSEWLENKIKQTKKAGMIVTMYIKYINFDLISKRRKSTIPFTTAVQIFDACVELLKKDCCAVVSTGEYVPHMPIRMLGIRVSEMVSTETMNIFMKNKAVKNPCERRCIICDRVFLNEPNFIFQVHVNKCIDESQKKQKEEKNTLKGLFKKKKK